jgi:hypothetical protein
LLCVWGAAFVDVRKPWRGLCGWLPFLPKRTAPRTLHTTGSRTRVTECTCVCTDGCSSGYGMHAHAHAAGDAPAPEKA